MFTKKISLSLYSLEKIQQAQEVFSGYGNIHLNQENDVLSLSIDESEDDELLAHEFMNYVLSL